MKKSNLKNIIITSSLFVLFLIFTILTKFINVAAIGPENSRIGFAELNNSINKGINANDIWDKLGDIFMLIALALAAFYVVIGIIQLVKRKKLFKVDKEILVLAIIYSMLAIIFVFFEIVVINYRPILVDGALEASYPSTHTLIVCTIMPISIILAHKYLQNKYLKLITDIFAIISILFSAVSRLLSGMHWFTDVIGAILISAVLVMTYYTLIKICNKDNTPKETDSSNKTEDTKETEDTNKTE